MDQQAFLRILQAAIKSGASDIHLQAGAAPGVRVKSNLMQIKAPPFTDADMASVIGMMVTDPKMRAKFSEIHEYDGSFEVKGLGRFRFNIFKNQGHFGAILRVIPHEVPSLDKLQFPPSLKKIASIERGLILVTGATGSGKTSTLAALIDFINQNHPVHILSIEDPIEFVHTPKKARITQREVGRDTESFAMALRAALRQDPDVILVGEMRDPETIDIALKAAETGHLVLSTVHTTDAAKTIGRLVSTFPIEAQAMVRLRLADNLAATVSQRLVPRADHTGLVAVQEIMINNAGIAECIADARRTGSMGDFIEKSFSEDGSGGQTFDQHLVQLFKRRLITLDTAKAAAKNAGDFERNLMFGEMGGGGPSDHEDEAAAKLREMTSVRIEFDHPPEPEKKEEVPASPDARIPAAPANGPVSPEFVIERAAAGPSAGATPAAARPPVPGFKKPAA